MANPEPLPEFSPKDIARFWSKVAVGNPGECWLWKGSTFRRGYGQFKAQGRNLKTHRVAYFLGHGTDPLDKLVCHECDNPPCCNPAHIFTGTPLSNLQDAAKKGRTARLVGELHHSHTNPASILRGEQVGGSKLTAEQVIDIRSRYAATDMSQYELATEYGVTRESIRDILKGKNWAHVGGTNLLDATPRVRRGELNGGAKLDADNVRQIRTMREQGQTPLEIAAAFGITRECVYHILNGRTWSHVT